MKNIGTKWQFNFFVALMTSWAAFDLFCKKQYNHKMLKQYIHRFFPVKKPKKKEKYTNQIFEKYEIPIKKHLNDQRIGEIFRLRDDSKDRSVDGKNIKEAIPVLVFNDYLLKNIQKYDTIYSNHYGNNICRLHFTLFDLRTGEYQGSDSECFPRGGSGNHKTGMLNNIEYLENFQNNYIVINTIEFDTSRENSQYSLNILLNTLKMCLKNKKTKPVINNMNIGIEFEIDYPNNDNPLKFTEIEEIIDKNIVSFSSGYDGSNDNEFNLSDNKITDLSRSSYNKSSVGRLFEDRIRLNGVLGLKSLEKYTKHLKENAALAKNSSIHIHIDCDYDKKNYRHITYNVRKYLIKHLTYCKTESFIPLIDYKKEILSKIKTEKIKRFDFKPNPKLWKDYNLLIDITDFIRPNSLGTVEYRGFRPTFNYCDIVCYILLSSYITRCAKASKNIEEKTILTILNAHKKVKKLYY